MTTSIKKLLLISITLLLGVMGGGVMAQTVTHIAGNEYSYNGVNYDISYVNTSYSVDSPLLNSQPWFTGSPGKASVATSFASAVGTNLGSPAFAFYESAGSTRYIAYLGSGLVVSGVFPDATPENYAVATLHSVGAPEIDGSLAPKVGFLLGCLFLMFGRKKQNTEPMLTA